MKKLILLPALLLLLSACSDKGEELILQSIRLDQTAISIDYEEEVQLTVSPDPMEAVLPKLVWQSDERRIAEVDSAGNVTGKIAGITKIKVETVDGKFSDMCEVTINPTNHLYKEPILDFNAPQSSVINLETRNLSENKEGALLYEGENAAVRYVMYLFDDEVGTLNLAMVLLAENEYVAEQVVYFLAQRYELVGYDGSLGLFSWNGISAGLTYDQDLGLVVIYLEDAEGGAKLLNARISSSIPKMKKMLSEL